MEEDKLHQLHQRIASFHRESMAPEDSVRQSMTELEHSLAKEHKRRYAHHRETAEHLKKIYAPIADLVSKDERSIQGTRALREMASRQRSSKPVAPRSPDVRPFLTSGSILSFISKPYDYQWSWSNQGGGGMAGETANKSTGDFDVGASGNNGYAVASAGVGMAFHPIATNELLRFSPLVNYAYQWADTSHIDTAHNAAFIGVYIQKYDENWQYSGVIVDHRIQLWSDGTSWYEPHGDSGGGHLNDGDHIGVQLYIPVSSNNNYIFWVWCSSSVDDGGDLDSIYWSRASAQLFANVPFVVFEQFPG